MHIRDHFQHTHKRFLRLPEWIRALFVGGIAFGIDTSLLLGFTEVLGIYYLLSACVGFLVGSVMSYVLSTWLVFRHRTLQNRQIEFVVFFLVGVLGLGLHEALMWFLTEQAHLHYLLSKLGTAVVLFLWNYLVRKWLLFRQKTIDVIPSEMQPREP